MAAPTGQDDAALARLRARLADRADADGLLDVAYRTMDSPIGPLLLAATPAGLVRVAFERENHDDVLAELSRPSAPGSSARRAGSTTWPASSTSTSPGGAAVFEVAVDLQLSKGFRRAVLTHLLDIPYGVTESYTVVAAVGREPGSGAGGRQRLRHQPHSAGRALPPGGAQRRDLRPVPGRPRGQAHAPDDGGGPMIDPRFEQMR